MNAISIVGYILSGIIMSFTCHYIWKKLLDIKYKRNIFLCLVSFFVLAILMFLNYKFNVSYIKIVSIIIIVFLIVRIFYCNDFKKSIIVSLFTEFMFIVSELIFSLVVLCLIPGNIEYVMTTFFGTLFTNSSISLISAFVVNLSFVRKTFDKLIEIINSINIPTIMIIFIIFSISMNLCLIIPYISISIIGVVIINTLFMLIYSYIIYKYIEQKNRYIDISDKYSLSENSLKELQSNVNRLMTINHENKNQLVTIRGMVAHKEKDEDILNCLDTMIDKKVKDDQDLKVRTSVISNTMLGSLIYSKLLTMKENKIKYNLLISDNINKSHIINIGTNLNVDICKIIGVYLDNAIEATTNITIKEINIEFYLKHNVLYIVISNTFDGNVDMSCINEYGYTTKEDGHGFGLSLVREIVKDNDALDTETEVLNNEIFIQKLKIKM